MFLSVKEMELRKIRFDVTFEPGRIDFREGSLEQVSALRATGVAEIVPHSEGEVHIQGSYSVEMTAECDRCLGRARFPLEEKLDLYYRPSSLIARSEEVEIGEEEAEVGFYEGSGLGLEDILREQVLLSLPMQRVCSDLCKGICPVCGRNRNETECGCKPETVNDRWGALRDLAQ
jgi:uncharacterized protein